MHFNIMLCEIVNCIVENVHGLKKVQDSCQQHGGTARNWRQVSTCTFPIWREWLWEHMSDPEILCPLL
jgi:hypothetical protein